MSEVLRKSENWCKIAQRLWATCYAFYINFFLALLLAKFSLRSAPFTLLCARLCLSFLTALSFLLAFPFAFAPT
jgi:hypothetical protein